MQIIWKGQGCFQLLVQKTKNGQTAVVIDPFSEEENGLKLSPLEADILLFSDKPTPTLLKPIKGNPFPIYGPGEYEVRDIFIRGIPAIVTKREKGEEAAIFIIEAEEMRLCHLGKLRQRELTAEQIEEIGDIDILLLPVGGNNVPSGAEARKIISQIEPKIIIPMYYLIPGLKIKIDGVNKFLQLMGIKSVEPLNKLLIKKKDIPQEETKIIVLNPQ